MTTAITHYAMQDLASPYGDLERLPRLTAEEEAALLHNLHFAQKAPAAKQRLIENAKGLIKRFRAEGSTSSDSVERYLPEWEFVWLNRREHQRTPTLSHPVQRVS